MNDKTKIMKFGIRDSGFGFRAQKAKRLSVPSSRGPVPSSRIPNPGSRIPSARGLTLIELMVASAIIVVLILSVGTVLSGLGLLVQVSQSAIRVNAKASAIATVLRADTRRASQCGFICITQAAADGSPQFFAFVPGTTASTTGGAKDLTGTGIPGPPIGQGQGNFLTSGSGALACVGQCDNTGLGSVLWHTTWEINTAASQGSDSNVSDSATPCVQLSTVKKYLRDPREYQCLNRWDCNNVVAAFQTAVSEVTYTNGAPYTLPTTNTPCPSNAAVPFTLPPGVYNSANNPDNGLNDLSNLWKILSLYGSELSIQWTDGTVDSNGVLQWYGILYNPGAPGTATANLLVNGVIGTYTYTIPSGWYAYSKSVGYVLPANPALPASYPMGDVTTYNGNAASLPAEFTFTSGGANQKYRAVFCHSDNASVWPTAIKIRFNLADPDAPKEFDMGNSGYLGAGSVYDETTQTFNVGALVEYGGRTYRCVQINGANTSVGYQLPTNTAYWCLSGTYFEIICPISQ